MREALYATVVVTLAPYATARIAGPSPMYNVELGATAMLRYEPLNVAVRSGPSTWVPVVPAPANQVVRNCAREPRGRSKHAKSTAAACSARAPPRCTPVRRARNGAVASGDTRGGHLSRHACTSGEARAPPAPPHAPVPPGAAPYAPPMVAGGPATRISPTRGGPGSARTTRSARWPRAQQATPQL